MELVSNFIENILTIEASGAETKQKNDQKNIEEPSSEESGPEGAKLKKVKKMAQEGEDDMKDDDKKKPMKKTEPDYHFWSRRDSQDESKPNTFLVDRLMEMVLSMIIPMDIKKQGGLSDRIKMQETRPPLSVNLMSKNSILLNQRLSVAFQLLDNVIKFCNWSNPYLTVGVLLIYTHVVLNPYLLISLPIFYLLNNVMVFHLAIIYPQDGPLDNSKWLGQRNPNIPNGPPIHEAKVPAAVPELSYEFILNLTDLQNQMLLYVVTYDFVVWLTKDFLYFKNEDTSSIVYLILFACLFHNLILFPKLFPIIVRYAPVRPTLIMFGWVATILLHPSIRGRILEWLYNEDTRLYFVSLNSKAEDLISRYLVRIEDEKWNVDIKEVEIFELQVYNKSDKQWESIGFVNDFYTINVPKRMLIEKEFEKSQEDPEKKSDLSGIRRVSSLEDIEPPKGWAFTDSPWRPDLEVEKWVNDSLIHDVVAVDPDEKWVYDLESLDTKHHFRRRKWHRYCTRHTLRKGSSHSDTVLYTDYLL